MFEFYDDLIGSISKGNIKFYGSDRKEKFIKNLNKLHENWYYRTHEVTYNFNSHGHRCDDLSSLDFENYILFLGDSHTVGIGLELEKTYAYISSKSLGLPYYNLGIGGTGIDVMLYNLITWLSKYPKPKYICMFWSDVARSFFKDKNDQCFKVSGPWDDEENVKNMYRYGDASGYFDARLVLVSNMIKNTLASYKIPNSSFTIFSIPPSLVSLPIQHVSVIGEHARDLSHFGIKTHKNIADSIVNDYNKIPL